MLSGYNQVCLNDVNFEDAAFDSIITYKDLNASIASKMTDDKRYYIFLDEIQQVEHVEEKRKLPAAFPF
jgi:predicted AAA+ superfamily ATPase